MICERCGREVHFLEKCEYCNRKICASCVKSSKKLSRVRRIVICKDCWGEMEKRKAFKSEA